MASLAKAETRSQWDRLACSVAFRQILECVADPLFVIVGFLKNAACGTLPASGYVSR
ncbi:hypothetical protein SBA1_20049 [Candidatus Sulfotelmatobacter kueseliae]|uniref:Uncharacterized protein n=1 Tax=Candidatus Sulfotelmatobacter kueseliae TaxID=2042962 RepID=A0A2U3KFB2_9BACT|nr:hypothetical protein SBA1_20049 [Candidatus Sulfotelmatobacter kueseliae]